MEPHLAEDEDLQKLKNWWKKNGTSIIVGIVLGLGAIGGVNGWRAYEQNRAETASTLFGNLQAALATGQSGEAEALVKELRDDFFATPYAASGALVFAANAHESAKQDVAKEHLNWVIANASAEGQKHTARIRLAWLELAAGDHAAALALAQTENVEGFEVFYSELQAEAHAAAGNATEAVRFFDETLKAIGENSDYAEIIRAKRNAVASAE